MHTNDIDPIQAKNKIDSLQLEITSLESQYQRQTNELKLTFEDLIRKDEELKQIIVERDKLRHENEELRQDREDLRVKWELLKRDLKWHQDNLAQQRQQGCWKLIRALIFAILASSLFYAATSLENLGNSMLTATPSNSLGNAIIAFGWITYTGAAIITCLLPFMERGK